MDSNNLSFPCKHLRMFSDLASTLKNRKCFVKPFLWMFLFFHLASHNPQNTNTFVAIGQTHFFFFFFFFFFKYLLTFPCCFSPLTIFFHSHSLLCVHDFFYFLISNFLLQILNTYVYLLVDMSHVSPLIIIYEPMQIVRIKSIATFNFTKFHFFALLIIYTIYQLIS